MKLFTNNTNKEQTLMLQGGFCVQIDIYMWKF